MAVAQLIFTMVVAAPPSAAGPLEQARLLAEEGNWAQAARRLSPVVDPERAAAGPLALLTRAVLEAGDLRRARLLAERGLLRFPDDLGFRRLDLAVLVARRQWAEASAAARSILAEEPTDRIAWRQLAAATLQRNDDADKRVVLEAAHLAQPDDPVIYEKHVRAQFLAEHLTTAADLVEAAIGRPALTGDRRFVRLAVRVGEAAGRPALARRWLAKIPPAERDTALSLLEARIALTENKPRTAEAALKRLIDRGVASPAVLVRAGQMAEARGAFGRAEALYAQAAEGEGDEARVARLFLGRFLAKIGNRERARQVVHAYLAEYPADGYARQLLNVLR